MLHSTFLLAASAAFTLPVFATPLGDGSGLVFHHEEARQENTCVAADVSTDPDTSTYKFSINAEVEKSAAANNLTRLGVRQLCKGTILGVNLTQTENWAYTDLTKFGADQEYSVDVKRCNTGRQVKSYLVWLCNDDDDCTATNLNCGLGRGICNEEDTKAVDLVDPEVWTCPYNN